MKPYLYLWNPKRWNWIDFQDAIYRVNNNKIYDIYWSCGNTKRITIGDMFLLMKLGVEPKGIIGCGYITSVPYELPHWDVVKAGDGKTTLRTDLLFKSLVETPIVTLAELNDKFPQYNWTPQTSGLSIPEEIFNELYEYIQSNNSFKFTTITLEEILKYSDGKPKVLTYKTYDRNVAARQKCLEYYGYDCTVCGFNFSDRYGDIGRNYIEVHHLKPIADIAMEHEIEPIKDLRPVCANCHRMLHKRRPVLSIEELKSHISSYNEH